MKLIVGLGNPGKNYDKTRHNFGFMVVDNLVQKNNLKFKQKNKYLYCKDIVMGEQVIILKPLTFMNLSGEAINEIRNFYKISIEDMIVIYDDLDSDFGKIKIKKNSSSGGHNGVKSIISHLGTQDFLKVKLGINNELKKNVKDFVLSNFTKDEEKEIEKILIKVEDIIYDHITGLNSLELMNKYN